MGSGGIAASRVRKETQPISRQAKRPEQPEQAEDLLLAEQLAPLEAERLRSLGYGGDRTLRGARVRTETESSLPGAAAVACLQALGPAVDRRHG